MMLSGDWTALGIGGVARQLDPIITIAIPPKNDGAKIVVDGVNVARLDSAVIHAPSSARSALRLDTQVLSLQQEFENQPRHIRFMLRATLVDDASHRAIATRDFEAVVTAPSDDDKATNWIDSGA